MEVDQAGPGRVAASSRSVASSVSPGHAPRSGPRRLVAGMRVQLKRGRSITGQDLRGQKGRIRVVPDGQSSITLDDGSPVLCWNKDLMPSG